MFIASRFSSPHWNDLSETLPAAGVGSREGKFGQEEEEKWLVSEPLTRKEWGNLGRRVKCLEGWIQQRGVRREGWKEGGGMEGGREGDMKGGRLTTLLE